MIEHVLGLLQLHVGVAVALHQQNRAADALGIIRPG